jgi:hypothetical protein
MKRWTTLLVILGGATGSFLFGFYFSWSHLQAQRRPLASSSRGSTKPEINFNQTIVAEKTASIPKVTAEKNKKNDTLLLEYQTDAVSSVKLALSESNYMKRARAFARAVNHLKGEEFPQILSLLEALPAGNEKTSFIQQIIDVWATVDPRASMNYSQMVQDKALSKDLINRTLKTWATLDMQGALGWLYQLPQGSTYDAAFKTLILSLVRTNPEKALEFVNQLPPEKQKKNFLDIFSEWGRVNIQKAVAKAKELSDDSIREDVLLRLSAPWAQSDMQGVSQFAESLKVGKLRDSLIRNVAITWIEQDPEAGLAWVRKISNGQNVSGLISEAVYGWSRRDPVGAADFVASLEKKEQERLISFVADALSKKDIELSLSWVEKLEGETKSKALLSILKGWSTSDSSAAAKYIDLMPGSAEKDNTILNLASQWAITNPKEALAWTEKLPIGMARSNAIANCLQGWASSDPRAASQFAESLPAGSTKQSAMAQIAAEWAKKDINAAAQWSQGLVEEGAQGAAIQSIVSQWAHKDPQASAFWAAQLPEDLIRDQALSSSISVWANKDLQSVSGWVNALPTGKMRDVAIGGIVNQVANSDPGLAARWTDSITDATVRKSASRTVGYAWIRKDQQAATAWLQRCGFSEKELNSMTQPQSY